MRPLTSTRQHPAAVVRRRPTAAAQRPVQHRHAGRQRCHRIDGETVAHVRRSSSGRLHLVEHVHRSGQPDGGQIEVHRTGAVDESAQAPESRQKQRLQRTCDVQRHAATIPGQSDWCTGGVGNVADARGSAAVQQHSDGGGHHHGESPATAAAAPTAAAIVRQPSFQSVQCLSMIHSQW